VLQLNVLTRSLILASSLTEVWIFWHQ